MIEVQYTLVRNADESENITVFVEGKPPLTAHSTHPNYQAIRAGVLAQDEKVYALRESWAINRGLMKKGPNPYYDDITQAAEEPFCRCYIVWIYALRDLPKDMLTVKGSSALDEARAAVAAM